MRRNSSWPIVAAKSQTALSVSLRSAVDAIVASIAVVNRVGGCHLVVAKATDSGRSIVFAQSTACDLFSDVVTTFTQLYLLSEGTYFRIGAGIYIFVAIRLAKCGMREKAKEEKKLLLLMADTSRRVNMRIVAVGV